MPNLGDSTGGLLVLRANNLAEAQQIVRENERSRIVLPDIPEPWSQMSEDTRCFIYNASPFKFHQEMASYGTYFIPPIEQSKVFDDELTVAGPLIIPGVPMEYYPADGPAKILPHAPPKHSGRGKHPGYDFAVEILGGGSNKHPESDLRNQGVFISMQPERKKPAKGDPTENWKAYDLWRKDVVDARRKLREFCAKECQRANMAASEGKFNDFRTDKLYVEAAIIKATELDFPWLKDSIDAADKKLCWSCGTTMKSFVHKCPNCAELQVPVEVFEAAKAKRMNLTS